MTEIRLPEQFQTRMQEMLGRDWPAFLACYRETPRRGLRVNTGKISAEDFAALASGLSGAGGVAPPNDMVDDRFPLSGEGVKLSLLDALRDAKRVPWAVGGFYVPEGVFPARHPFYAAGLYYLQEPSAMAPAEILPVRPGMRVLDLCAAPGGKATRLAERLSGQGALVANDASTARARALLRNLELFGARNAVVTSETPARLARNFADRFDAILVDAPCSGEGMFRRDPEVAKCWSESRVREFSKTQREILSRAAGMLREGGFLLYSTCTFSPEENEGNVSWFLSEFPEFSLCEIEEKPGFSPGEPAWGDGRADLARCVRIWPHMAEGEGHFLALLRKAGEHDADVGFQREGKRGHGAREKNAGYPGAAERKLLQEFLDEIGLDAEAAGFGVDLSAVEQRGSRAFLRVDLSTAGESAGGRRSDRTQEMRSGRERRGGQRLPLHILRSGLFLGEWKKNRFEPSQPFALAIDARTIRARANLAADDARVAAYLRGEEIPVEPGDLLEPDHPSAAPSGSSPDVPGLSADWSAPAGWKLVCADGFALGWGKLSGGRLKNRLPASWRVL